MKIYYIWRDTVSRPVNMHTRLNGHCIMSFNTLASRFRALARLSSSLSIEGFARYKWEYFNQTTNMLHTNYNCQQPHRRDIAQFNTSIFQAC
jgi:hypothetical protein